MGTNIDFVKALPLPALNIDLLGDIVAWAVWDASKAADDEDERFVGWGEWEQGAWAEEKRNGVCQTSFCMAGQAVAQSGFQMVLVNQGEVGEGDSSYNYFVASTCVPTYVVGRNSNGTEKRKAVPDALPQSISQTAKEMLGITQGEADALFSGSNSIQKVVYLASAIARSRGYDLGYDSAEAYTSFENINSYIGNLSEVPSVGYNQISHYYRDLVINNGVPSEEFELTNDHWFISAACEIYEYDAEKQAEDLPDDYRKSYLTKREAQTAVDILNDMESRVENFRKILMETA